MPLQASDFALVSRLLDEAMDLAPADVRVWLEALPPEHAHLRRPLREMLAAKNSATQCRFLESGPRLENDDDAGDDGLAVGGLVGPYRLVRELGRGGMGVVWLANRADGHFERQIALKLPRLGRVEGLGARMARERRIGALLEHPHIARLYDAGVDADGRSYIAMEYVDGLAIDAWCKEHACTVAQQLKLFVQVVRAVAYAHGRLVVHRDLKPANILVNRQAQVRLLDFGIAKLMEEAATTPTLTHELGRLMTRHYASPEQIAGKPVGVATDVYSLGVTLFELLAGTSPYRPTRDTPAALEEAVLLGHLPLPSSAALDPGRQRALRGDIDAILSKALALDPQARYPSADSMADDIERHLAGERIGARRAGWWHGLRLRARRHRVPLSLVVLLLVAGAAGSASTWLQARRASQEAERARIVTAFVSDLFRVHADSALQGPRPGSEPGASFLAGPAEPAGSGATASSQAAQNAVADMIQGRFSDRPDLLAQLYGAVAGIYADLGVGQLAVDFAGLQLQWLVTTGADSPTRAAALSLLSRAYTVHRRYEPAEQQARAAVALLPDLRSDQALEAHADLAAILLSGGKTDEVNAIFAAIERSLPLSQRQPSVALARMLEVHGALAEIENRFDEARALWQRGLNMAIALDGPTSRHGNAIRFRLAVEELARNRLRDARRNMADYTEALAATGFAGRIQTALAASRFAEVGSAMGLIAPAEARALHEDARRVVTDAGPALPRSRLATVEVRLGALALQFGDLATARELLLRAVPVAQAASDGLIDARGFATRLGELAMASGDHDEAARQLQRRRDLRVRSGGGRSPAAVFDWVLLSHNELMRGDAAAALAFLDAAPDFAASSGDLHAAGLEYRHAIAEQRVRIALQEGQIAVAQAALPPEYGVEPWVDVAMPTLATHALRGEVLCAAGRPAAGLPYLQASLRELESAQSPVSPALARLRAVAGLCAWRLGDAAMARRLATLSQAALATQPQVSAWYRRPLAALQAAQGAGC